MQKKTTYLNDYQYVHPLFFVAIGIILGFFLAHFISNIQGSLITDFWEGVTPENLAPEFFGMFITVIIIDGLNKRRSEKAAKEERKQRLIYEFGSYVNDVARKAAEELRRHGMLFDGTLKGANLIFAELKDAKLDCAHLEGAHLGGANLEDAKLVFAELKDAKLEFARLEGADLSGADLLGANLKDARLEGAHLFDAKFDESTMLPDESYWTLETDMERFTNPQHPDFWKPEDYNYR